MDLEKELAKRSHYFQKVIKRYKTKVKELETSKEVTSNGTKPAVVGLASKQGRNNKGAYATAGDAKPNDDLIQFLEQKLEDIEKKLVKTQNETELLQQEYLDLQGKMSLSREKYKRAALLMTEFLDNLLNSAPNILDTDPEYNLNLERIKATNFEDLEKEDKVALVLVLLKQLQPYLSAGTMST